MYALISFRGAKTCNIGKELPDITGRTALAVPPDGF